MPNNHGSIEGTLVNVDYWHARRKALVDNLAMTDLHIANLNKQAIARIKSGETTGDKFRDMVVGVFGYVEPAVKEYLRREHLLLKSVDFKGKTDDDVGRLIVSAAKGEIKLTEGVMGVVVSLEKWNEKYPLHAE